jgi:hypothetical protein
MGETSRADREILLQGGLSATAVRGMAEFVKVHYLDPNLESLEGRAYRERPSDSKGAVELEWGFAPLQVRR